jgi:hypothetical protein
MKCQTVKEWFSEYIEGKLDQCQREFVKEHLEKCESCQAELNDIRHVWWMLDDLTQVEVPSSFRHEVVMRAARQQHETRRKLFTFSFDPAPLLDSLTAKLIPARGLAVAGALVVLATLVFKVPQVAYQYLSGGMGPAVAVKAGVSDSAVGGDDSSPLTQYGSDLKHEWQARKLGRNILWIGVTSKDNGDGRMLYRVMLSLNKDALLRDTVTQRVGVKVALMKPGDSNVNGELATDWQGSVLDNAPVLVPVIVDRSQASAGPIDLVVSWKYHKRAFSQVVIIPTMQRASSDKDVFGMPINEPVPVDGSEYVLASLQSVAQQYGVPVIVPSTLCGKPIMAQLGKGNLNESLTTMLKPSNLDWLVADQAVYVDDKSLSANSQ